MPVRNESAPMLMIRSVRLHHVRQRLAAAPERGPEVALQRLREGIASLEEGRMMPPPALLTASTWPKAAIVCSTRPDAASTADRRRSSCPVLPSDLPTSLATSTTRIGRPP
jgi:hypothetical protein